MDKETVIKMIDEYLAEANISKEWREALTLCRRELTKSTPVSDPIYINHPLCDACRDYGDIYLRDCNKCEVKEELLRRSNMNCKDCIHNDFCNVHGYIDADECEFYKNRGGVIVDKIKVKLDKFAFKPVRAHADDAGLDLRSPSNRLIYPRESATIDTGVHIAIPKGYVGMLKSKSGLNVNHGITSEGVIDAGYTGSIKCKLYNNSDCYFRIKAGDKITQLVIMPIITPEIEYVDELEDTERGSDGFGSSGK